MCTSSTERCLKNAWLFSRMLYRKSENTFDESRQKSTKGYLLPTLPLKFNTAFQVRISATSLHYQKEILKKDERLGGSAEASAKPSHLACAK